MIEVQERSMTLRALMTAKDSPTCRDLRCPVRRGLVEFLRHQRPEALPVVRMEPGPAPTTGGAQALGVGASERRTA